MLNIIPCGQIGCQGKNGKKGNNGFLGKNAPLCFSPVSGVQSLSFNGVVEGYRIRKPSTQATQAYPQCFKTVFPVFYSE